MNPQTPPQDLNASAPLPSSGITIIYEDRETGLRAKQFSDHLSASLGNTTTGDPALWRLELIDLPTVAERLSRDAAGGEFLILALRGDTSLSTASKRWLESWLETTNAGTTHLVALFDPARSIAPIVDSIRCYLQQVAGEAGIAFFAHGNLTTSKSTGPKSKRLERRQNEGGGVSANSAFAVKAAVSFPAEYLAV